MIGLTCFHDEASHGIHAPPSQELACHVVDLIDEGADHYAVALLDPEGNEFDIN